jgi:two-component sensor histidine kinase
MLRRFALAFAVLTVALTGFLMRQQYQAARLAGHVRAEASAHLVATQFGWTLEASRQALRRIDDALARMANPFNAEMRVGDIAQAVSDLPAGYQYSVQDAEGNLRFSSVPGAPEVNVADRAFFRNAARGRMLSISPMVADGPQGQQVFVVARRLEQGGRFLGVATIKIPVTALSDLALSLGLGSGSTISLIRTDGWLIARSPPIEPMDLSGGTLFTKLKTASHGTYDSPASPADGVPRIVGYWSMDGWPLVAVASVDDSETYARFGRAMLLWAAVALPVLTFSAWLFLRLDRALTAEAARVAALDEANARNESLIREIHHRVKNNLQTVVSLIRLQKSLPEEQKQALLGRLRAMSAVHEATYKSEQFEVVELAPYLRRLTAEIIAGYGGTAQAELDLEEAALPGQRAMHLGLLVNELLSNAIKHGLKGRPNGRLWLSLRRKGTMLHLTVADDGPGHDPAAVTANMGSRLIDSFVAILGGRREVRVDGGTVVEVVFPEDIEAATAEAEAAA